MKKIKKEEVILKSKEGLKVVSDRLKNLDKEQKKKVLGLGVFVLLLLLALSSNFLSTLIPIALVSYMLSQVGSFKEELGKLTASNKKPQPKAEELQQDVDEE